KTVLIVGSGDAAIEEGMFLTKFAKKVYVSIIHDEGTMDANKVAQEKALKNEKMEFIWNTVVDSFEGDERLNKVVLKNLKTGELVPVDVDGCFLFIGYIPNTDIFKGLIDMSSRGYITTNENMETNVDGIFAAGDVRDKFLRQVSTAVGDAAVAGVMAEKYVEELNYIKKEIIEADGLVGLYIYNAIEAGDREKLAQIEQLHGEMNDAFKLCRNDIYKSDKMARRFECEKSPCLVLLNKGQVVQRVYDIANAKVAIENAVKAI
ncbi:MAG: FAD-dependent oxidoreductase, partial [Clostridiaceae bacterium]